MFEKKHLVALFTINKFKMLDFSVCLTICSSETSCKMCLIQRRVAWLKQEFTV